MAPKRRPPPPTSTAARAPTQRASKLAKEHGVTAAQESEIREAYSLFCIADPHHHATDHKDKKQKTTATSGKAAQQQQDDTVIRTADVRRCLIALNAPPSDASEMAELIDTLDPERVGVVAFEHFFAIAAMKVQSRYDRDDGEGEDEEEDEEEEYGGRKGKGRDKGKGRAHDGGSARTDAEIKAAFGLFTRGEGEMITLAHLRRVARELREEVDDKTLKDMIREANGGVRPGVVLEEFGETMRRAGVFG